MADTKIASLTDGTSTSATDRIPVAISPYGSGNNAYITPAYLKTFMVTGGTVTTSTPVFDMTQTWNAGAQAFTGLKINVTDTASAAGSLLLDLQVGGSSKASVTKSGDLTATTVTLSSGFGGVSNSGGPWAASTGRFAFGGNFAGPFLQYDGNSATLGLRDSTNAQTFNVYNTSTSANANYERLALKWSSNVAIIGTEAGGTGSSRTLQLLSATSLIQICGTTSGFPALKRNSGSLEVRAADDSGFASLQCAGIVANGDLVVGAAYKMRFGGGGGRVDLTSPADKVLKVADNAGGASIVQLQHFTVAGLPSAATYTGSVALVSDANATTARSTVAGGGSNKVMVMSDGANWLIVA